MFAKHLSKSSHLYLGATTGISESCFRCSCFSCFTSYVLGTATISARFIIALSLIHPTLTTTLITHGFAEEQSKVPMVLYLIISHLYVGPLF